MSEGDAEAMATRVSSATDENGNTLSSRAIVVAHYSEDLDWLVHPHVVGTGAPTHIHIYHKRAVGEEGEGGKRGAREKEAMVLARLNSLSRRWRKKHDTANSGGNTGNTDSDQPPLPPLVVARARQLNIGNECSAYLQYIVDHYDCLSDVTFFLQAGT